MAKKRKAASTVKEARHAQHVKRVSELARACGAVFTGYAVPEVLGALSLLTAVTCEMVDGRVGEGKAWAYFVEMTLEAPLRATARMLQTPPARVE